jgi:hypothetical protein
MTLGYVYVLQNTAYGAYVLKIGRTTREPNIRAQEVYAGASGVPVPFDVAAAFSVGDCIAAEKSIHKRLRSYRLNNRREFFRIRPDVAELLVAETCAEINKRLGLAAPRSYSLLKRTARITAVGSAERRTLEEDAPVINVWIKNLPDQQDDSAARVVLRGRGAA